MEKEKFKEDLKKLVELGKSKKSTLDMNDINDFFAGTELSVEQIEDIISYLENNGIDVLRVMNNELAIDDDMVMEADEDEFPRTRRKKRILTWTPLIFWTASVQKTPSECT